MLDIMITKRAIYLVIFFCDLLNIVRRHNTDARKVQHLVNVVVELGGIKYAEKKMWECVENARSLLHHFESSAYRDSLEQLVNFTIQRNK